MAIINGTPFDDNDFASTRLFGTDGDDTLSGLAGDDWLNWSLGNDSLDGGEGFDVVFYEFGPAVFVNNTGQTIDGVAPFTVLKASGTDTLVGIEAFHGSDGDDTIHAGRNGYVFDLGGNDEIFAQADSDFFTFLGGSGNDSYTGGDGNDRLDFATAQDGGDGGGPGLFGANVDLAAGTATDPWGDSDTLVSIEDVTGSPANDTIRGDDGDNELQGEDGDDLLEGRDGDDWIEGGAGDDTINGNGGNDRLRGEDGDDSLLGGDGNDTLEGGDGNDTLIPGAQDDYQRVEPGTGSDTIDFTGAGAGFTEIEYAFSGTDSVEVTLSLATDSGTVAKGPAAVDGTDTVVNFANAVNNFNFGLVTTQGDDSVTLDFDGQDGEVYIRAGLGDDTVSGSNGARVFYDLWRDVDFDQMAPQAAEIDLSLASDQVINDGFGFTDSFSGDLRVSFALTDLGDTFTGSGDDDFVRGEGGDDTLTGGAGDDNLRGDDGDDNLRGGEGDDFLQPGRGADSIDGGTSERDFDELSYIFQTRDDPTLPGITVTFTGEKSGSIVDYGGDTDVFTGIEAVRGTNAADIFTGAEGDQTFRGFGGDDQFDGGAGDRDRVDYSRARADVGASRGVDVDLAAGSGTDAYGDTDTFAGIEEIRGTNLADTIRGDDGDNELQGEDGDDLLEGRDGDDWIEGGAGEDTLRGGAGEDDLTGGQGADTLDGGGGDRDEVRYETRNDTPATGVTVNLVTGTATDQWGDTDTLIGIEWVRGSDFDDVITGDDGNNDINGGAGNDELIGGAGGDFLQAGAGDDTIEGGANGELGEEDTLSYIFESFETEGPVSGIAVTFTAEGDGTVLDFAGGTDVFTGIERVLGTMEADVFTGAAGDQTFSGYGGDDAFEGGVGDGDRVDYSRAEDHFGPLQGVDVDLAAGSGTDAYGDTDTFAGIEEVRGTNLADTIRGDGNRNELEGEGGDDLIDSAGGVDNFIDGGSGNDEIFARGDDDFVLGGDGNDVVTFFGEGGGVDPGLGSDTITGGTEGFFFLEYFSVATPVVIDVAAGRTELATGDVDLFSNIRNIAGGQGDDTLRGDDLDARQEYFSTPGDDRIEGRAGLDMLVYDNRQETGVTVDLAAGTATGAYAGNDTFSGIEEVRGSAGNDVFIGADVGDRTMFQGLDGVDSYTGGPGLDRISFSFDDNRGGNGAIFVDLAALRAVDGFGNEETFTGIEQAISGDQDDRLFGDEVANVLIGLLGADSLDGRGGDDELYAGGGADTVTGGAGADIFGGRIWELEGDTITDFEAEDEIAVYDEDFNLLPANLTIVGDRLEIDLDDDGVAEATMTLANGYTGPVTSTGGALAPPAPEAVVFSIEAAGLFAATLGEAAGTVDLTVTRSGAVDVAASVAVAVMGHGLNPATSGADFEVISGSILDFAAGQTEAVVQVRVLEDLLTEPAEDLRVTLSEATTAAPGGAQIAGAEAYLRILDNDLPATVSIVGGRAAEDSGTLTFTVTRTGDLSAPLEVGYDLASAGGVQGAEADDLVDGFASGTVTILAGQASADIELAIVTDSVAEAHDDVIATLRPMPGWPAGLQIGTRAATGSIRNDDGVPAASPDFAVAANWGDPHLVTLDGLGYDFHAVGEFTLLEAVSGPPLTVQVRYVPVPGSDVASQTAAVATEVGTDRVVVDLDAADLVRVNGLAADLDAATAGLALDGGSLFYDGEAVTVVYASGEQLRIEVAQGFLNTVVAVAPGRDVRGLLGDGDGDPANDLALRDGTVLAQPVPFATLYGAYAEAWRIDDASSLFDYPEGLGTADFTDLNFPAAVLSLDDVPEVLRAQLEAELAGITDPVQQLAAIFDALLLGSTEAAAAATASVPESSAQTAPDDAPALPQAVGVTLLSPEVAEGDAGQASHSFSIYRTGDAGAALEVSYAFSGTALGASDTTGTGAGSVTLAPGETAAQVEIGVVGDLVPEDTETLTISIAAEGVSVLNDAVTLTILDNDLAGWSPTLAPVAISLDPGSLSEGAAPGAVAGTLVVADPNPDDSHVLELLDDAGGLFALDGADLVLAPDAALDFETATAHEVVVRATDDAGLSLERTLTVAVENVVEPGDVAELAGVVRLGGGGSAEGVPLELATAGSVFTAVTDATGGFAIVHDGGPATLRAVAPAERSNDGVTVGDALNVLRMAIGLDPNFGAADAFDFVAADVTRDGRVTVSDALEVLRGAIGLETDAVGAWVLVDAIEGTPSAGRVAYSDTLDLDLVFSGTEDLIVEAARLGDLGIYGI